MWKVLRLRCLFYGGFIEMKEELFLLAEKVSKEMRRRGASEVMVLPTQNESLMVRFSNNKVTVVQSWSVISIDMLSIFGKKRLISRFENIGENALAESIERVIKESSFVQESEELAPLPTSVKFKDRRTTQKIDANRINDYVSLAINSATREGAERVSGVFTGSIVRDAIIGSNGAEGYDERASFDLNVRTFTGDNSGQGLSCATMMSQLAPEEAGREAGSIVRMAKNPAKWSEGKYSVLLGPIIGAELIGHVGDSCSAFNVEAGTSCLTGKMGKEVLSKELTIADDGSSKDGPSSRSFDDEGTPTRKTVLLEKGTLKSYLHNVNTAKRFNTYSTGNAGWIAPSAWNLVIDHGKLSFEESLKELKNGIYMVSNWYTRFQNYSTGDFSTICRDGTFLVEDGEIKGSLKGVRISDNLLKIFQSIKSMGKDRRWVRWWEVRTPTFLPDMVLPEVNLTKAQES